MDFQELLEQADYNAAVNQTDGKKDGIKRYSSVLPPPKKIAKPGVQSDNIKRFLEKQKAMEAAKAAEREREKEKLLALRAQNSKNNKKAKIMASRTKDNDFSKIRMTDDEREAHKRREEELLRKNLADKVERMKARIEMEEREKLLPKKRKRKSKNGEIVETPMVDHDDLRNGYNESNNTKSQPDKDNYQPEKEKVRKPKPPPPPVMSFSDLLKIAEKRQVEPVEIVIKKKEEEKLMTKRERKIMEEDMARLRRKQERLLQQKSGLPKPSNSASVSTMNKNNVLGKEENKKPVVIHVKSDQDAKFKIPKSSVNTAPSKVSSSKPKDISPAIIPKSGSNSNSLGKPLKSSSVNEQKKVNRPKDDTRSLIKGEEIKKKIAVPKKNELKSNPVQMVSKKQAPQIDEEALKADIERKVQERLTKEREKLEKEIEEKIAAKFAQFQSMQPKVTEKIPEAPKQIKKEPVVEKKITKKIIEKPQSGSGFFKKDMERMIAMRKESIEKSSLKPKMPEKAFHKNPYLDPPRRLLEPQRPPRPLMKRRIESDDDDEEDDMSDFIDDGPSQNDEDYSKYIKEIFGYDRNRYMDDDDDEVMESSFEQQMKEEVKSARLGYLEDLEEERLEMERLKKRKKKLKN